MKAQRGIAGMLAASLLSAGVLAGCGGSAATRQAAGNQSAQGQNPDLQVEVPQQWDNLVTKARTQGGITLGVFKYQDFYAEMGKQFAAKYGIKVNIVSGSNDAIQQKVLAEKGTKGTIDVWALGGNKVESAVRNDLMLGPIASMLPNGATLDKNDVKLAEGFEQNGMAVPLYRNQSVFVYDTRFVKQPPADFAQLEQWVAANPKRFSYANPQKGGSGQAFVQSAIYHTSGNVDQWLKGFDQKMVDEKFPAAWAWLQKIGANTTYGSSQDDVLDKLNRGEVWLGVNWEDSVVQWQSKGQLPPTVKMYLPKPGMPGGADYAAVPKAAQHKAAALLFINFLLEKENEVKMAEDVAVLPARTDVQLPDAAKAGRVDVSTGRLPWSSSKFKDIYKADWIKRVGN